MLLFPQEKNLKHLKKKKKKHYGLYLRNFKKKT